MITIHTDDTTTSQVPCAGTDEPCVNTCTTGCVNGQYARPVTYSDGSVDYLTVNCACKGHPCMVCEAYDGFFDDYLDCA